MEQVLGEYVEPEPFDLGMNLATCFKVSFWTSVQQNRAYAVAQLSDLHQKLSKVQTSVTTTRAPIPVLQDKEGSASKVSHVHT